MTALNVITLADAKKELVVDATYTDRDAEITRIIQTAVSWVEQYTCYRLYEREETFIAYGWCTDLHYYPIEVTGVEHEGVPYTKYTEKQLPLGLRITCPNQSAITANVGYTSALLIPPPLIAACYKIIVYLFDNKDAYSIGLPIDVQVLVNQYRRSPTI